ncbi:MAG: transporter substrate-binding domain-containing protein [Bacteroidota bacterium]|nr:transporter substrate-binding domain-containing protein [Bacteroidota bacterium]
MKKLFTIFLFFTVCGKFKTQTIDTITINYFVHAPFCLNENEPLKGFEIDFINEYVLWLKTTKKQNVAIKYKSFTDQNVFYTATKSSNKNTIGLGSFVISSDKLKEIDFTMGYLKNVAFCITNGNAPDVKTKTPEEITKALGSMTALTLTNTTASKYILEIKKTYIKDLKINYQSNETSVLDEISKNVLNFGYVNALEFWYYLKANPSKFLKMQKILNQSKEEFGFILPKGSSHKTLFNEFFTTFKASRNYRAILEKYMGSYMTQNMAVN